MEIVLTVENAEALPSAAPATFTARGRSFLIGREDGDWTLPDPDMFISGCHCQIRFEPSVGFWLEDVSRNGTFLNGSTDRLSLPHLIRSGDRFRIGRYIVSATVAEAEVRPVQVSAAKPASPDPFFTHTGEEGGSSTPLSGLQPDPVQPEARRQTDAIQSGRRVLTPAAPGGPGSAASILADIAVGAGISPEVFRGRDTRELATEIGSVLRLVVEELSTMLKARAAAKMMTKTGHQTMISSAGNNPLKFVPGAEEMLEKMFTRRSSGYLDAKGSFEEAFRDLKTHEVATYAAMQAALSRLMEELSPETIEKRVPPSSFGSRRGRSWDAFVKTWEAREQAHENGMLDVFLAYFSESYASVSKQRK
ncbi:MAG: type VI secretion system-associated FHA domain protein TagH [Rhizobiaceae bacterium]